MKTVLQPGQTWYRSATVHTCFVKHQKQIISGWLALASPAPARPGRKFRLKALKNSIQLMEFEPEMTNNDCLPPKFEI